MKHKYTFALFIILALEVLVAFLIVAGSGHAILLDPQGSIALQQRNIMFTAAALMMLVVVPVFVLTFAIAWRYRASNTRAKYSPEWDNDLRIEFVWWAIPCAIILALAILTWQSTYALDPFRPLESAKKPVTVEVVALDWKWLFIYPELGIASVNFLQAPVGTPINFKLTSDAPMNSFWIPQLGGQIYTMTGMETKLHLVADAPGIYAGYSANISGKGFAGMKFSLKAVPEKEFDAWVAEVRTSDKVLTHEAYDALAEPSEKNPVSYYSQVEPGLFESVIHSFMGHMPDSNAHTMEGMHMQGMQI